MSAPLEYRLEEKTSAPAAEEPRDSDFTPKQNVLIYRNDLIERSETFVVAQVQAMRKFRGVYCGLTRCYNGIMPPNAPNAVLVHEGRARGFLKKRAFMYTGWARPWRRQCSTFEPVLMHAHFALDAAFALPLCKSLQLPLIVSIHGYDVTYSEATFRATAGGRLLLRRRKTLMARTNLFLCISEFIREKAIEHGYPREKLWVNSTGIDLDAFQSDGTTAREPLVVFVGRLVEKKGCIHLIRAMRSVQCRYPSANLVVIGDGPLRDELERLASAVLPGKHTFLGAQPVEEVRAWLRRAKVFSVPSVIAANGNAEGLGMVFLEAQAMGVPVVSFDSGGIAEAVTHGETGFLVKERDDASLADRIYELLEDNSLWLKMSRKGQVRMKERFDLKAQTEILEAKYVEVLAAASRAQHRCSHFPL